MAHLFFAEIHLPYVKAAFGLKNYLAVKKMLAALQLPNGLTAVVRESQEVVWTPSGSVQLDPDRKTLHIVNGVKSSAVRIWVGDEQLLSLAPQHTGIVSGFRDTEVRVLCGGGELRINMEDVCHSKRVRIVQQKAEASKKVETPFRPTLPNSIQAYLDNPAKELRDALNDSLPDTNILAVDDLNNRYQHVLAQARVYRDLLPSEKRGMVHKALGANEDLTAFVPRSMEGGVRTKPKAEKFARPSLPNYDGWQVASDLTEQQWQDHMFVAIMRDTQYFLASPEAVDGYGVWTKANPMLIREVMEKMDRTRTDHLGEVLFKNPHLISAYASITNPDGFVKLRPTKSDVGCIVRPQKYLEIERVVDQNKMVTENLYVHATEGSQFDRLDDIRDMKEDGTINSYRVQNVVSKDKFFKSVFETTEDLDKKVYKTQTDAKKQENPIDNRSDLEAEDYIRVNNVIFQNKTSKLRRRITSVSLSR